MATREDFKQTRRDYDFLKRYELTAMAAFCPGRNPDLKARKFLIDLASRVLYPGKKASIVWRTLWLRWYRKDERKYLQRRDEEIL